MPTVYRNGRIHSRAAAGATAFAVDASTVTWVGDEDAAAHYGGVGDVVVDLGGAFVTPAFVDAHVHTTMTGLALTGLDLRSAPSLRAALELVEHATRASRGRPILGSGWDESGWPERRAPTAAELDRAGYGGLVYLARVDAHSAVTSSALMAAVPRLRTMTGFRADGWQRGAAHDAVRVAALSGLSAGQRADAQRAALRRAAGLGIACVHEMAGPVISSADDLAGLLALSVAEPLPQVIGYWAELHGVQAARDLGAVGAAGDLFCDGSLGSHTAALSEPYADAPHTRGSLRHEVGELAEHIAACVAAGLQAGFHAIGDAAVDQALAAFELAAERLGRPAGAGSRLEHVEFVRDPGRLAAAGLMASMQPAFDTLWGGPAGLYAQRLGAERAGGLNRFAELAAAGVPLAFGSDSPVTELGPWATVRSAAHPSDPAAAISPRAAFAAHTRAGWRAAGIDGEGMLAPGAPATFAVWAAGELAVDAPDERVARWSTDPRAAVPGLPDVAPGVELPTCLATVLRGTPIHDRGLLDG
ncbi:amidohydrolase [uncultured Jatrophihabitans sp.]|uniref:amidohydrolase n=1 Tax=uncultured Jatrophihabitans sp. TaxID=1610747 RepID=UPI0035CC7798